MSIPGYTLNEVIGTSPVCRVHRATDRGGNVYAVKLWHPDVDTTRPKREISINNTIRQGLGDHNNPCLNLMLKSDYVHPRYVTVFPLVAGTDLDCMLRQKREPGVYDVLVALRMLIELTPGLAQLHEARYGRHAPVPIIHQDIKPSNIMMDRKGRVTLIDYEMATLKHAKSTDLFRGTLLYTSPEQVFDHPVDETSDIFSTGLVVGSVATRQHPFDYTPDELKRSTKKFRQVVRDRYKTCDHVPLSRKNKCITFELDDLVRKMIAPNPKDRMQTAQAVWKAATRIYESLLAKYQYTEAGVVRLLQKMIPTSGPQKSMSEASTHQNTATAHCALRYLS